MSAQRTIIFTGILASLIALPAMLNTASGDSRPNVVPAADAWQHLAMPVPVEDGFGSTPETSRKIVELGGDGWQLVDVETFAKAGTTTQMVYFFRRPKSD